MSEGWRVEHRLTFDIEKGCVMGSGTILDLAGLPRIRLYDLRHSAATIALAAGVSPKVVSEQLGHASTAFTLDTYAHVLPHMQDEAVAKVEAMLLRETA
ncbi:MAG: tyrosine-type recombinase/integrase [Candidatus Sulfotelmatobacter sp.]